MERTAVKKNFSGKLHQLPKSQTKIDHVEKIAAVCRLIENSSQLPPLQELAREAGLSQYHLHRLFKQVTGLTPKAYGQAHRRNLVQASLTEASSITEALYQAGYSSSGRFYEEADQTLGMKPQNYRNGGKDSTIYFALGKFSLGEILVARSERGICAILMGDDAEALLADLQERFKNATLIGGDSDFEKVVAAVIAFVEAPADPEKALKLPLDIQGTVFQQRVWQTLQKIPAGQTVTYSDIAAAIGAPQAVRAVASACAANKLAVVIPCHRVIRQDGSLSGYRWGLARKQALLDRESP